jgi:hypothetical protein
LTKHTNPNINEKREKKQAWISGEKQQAQEQNGDRLIMFYNPPPQIR